MKNFFKKHKKRIIIILFILILIIIAISIGIYLYFNNEYESSETIITKNEIIETDEISEDTDANIIAYLTIESIGLYGAPIAERNRYYYT